jgi:hypothetical protein
MEGFAEDDWQPAGWADWTRERRRIWRMEQQLLRWESIGLAAGAIALEQAKVLAELRDEGSPTRAEIDQLIIDRARAGWTGNAGAAFDLPKPQEDE